MAGAVGRAFRRFFLGATAADPRMRLDADAEIAVHVAVHAARSRDQAPGAWHILYGLLQDDAIRTAIERLGGDAMALEHRALDALDALDDQPPAADPDGRRAVAYAFTIGQGRGRPFTCADLWNALMRTDARARFEASDVPAIDILFVLAHGRPPPPLTRAPRERVIVELRNDDYTTQEFVVAVLRDVFALGEAAAITTMQSVHQHGRGTLGPLAAAEAHDKIATVRARAHERGFPLWIAIDDF